MPHIPAPLFWQVPCGSAAPFGTLLQAPSELGSPHDWQEPLHAELQQTPCAQNFDRHSVPSAQVLPNRNQHIRSQPDDTPIKLGFSKRRLDEWTEVDFDGFVRKAVGIRI